MKRFLFAALGVATLLGAVAGLASGGFTQGVGSSRTATLSDDANRMQVSVPCPETINGSTGFSYHFSLVGLASTHAATYNLSVVISPGRDTEARWNATVAVPAGVANTSADVVIPPNALPFTVTNTPFSIELIGSAGAIIDYAEFSVDLRYREPPPDGGLLALALASACVWGVVLLYTLNLHLAQRKLRARADALESAQNGPSAGVRADGKER
jgi:hypothetical protein